MRLNPIKSPAAQAAPKRPHGSAKNKSLDSWRGLRRGDAATQNLWGRARPLCQTTLMAMAISYTWLFQWDYTFHKWDYKYLIPFGMSGHNCMVPQRMMLSWLVQLE